MHQLIKIVVLALSFSFARTKGAIATNKLVSEHSLKLERYYSQADKITKKGIDISVALSVKGENEVLIGEDVTYIATVTNNSDLDAKDASLHVNLPKDSKFVSSSIPISARNKRRAGVGDIYFAVEQLLAGESISIEIQVDPADSVQMDNEASAYAIAIGGGVNYDPNGKNNRDNAFIDVVKVRTAKPLANESELRSPHTFIVPYRVDYVRITAEWQNKAKLAEIRLIDPRGNVISESDFEQYGIKLEFDSDEMRKIGGRTRSKTAHIRNPQWGSWQIQIVNPLDLGRISYRDWISFGNNIAPEITILPNIEQIDESQFKIKYEVKDPDSNDLRMDLYGDINREGYNGLPIDGVIGSIRVSKGEGSYILNTEGFAPGEYYLYATVTDEFSEYSSFVEPFSDYSTEQISVVREADISANITTDKSEVSIGDNLTYSVTATNKGVFNSRGVKVLVGLPDNVEIVSQSQTNLEPQTRFEKAASDLIFDVGNLPPGATYSVDLTVKVVADEDGSLSYLQDAFVFLQSDTYDPDPKNSSYSNAQKAEVDIFQPPRFNFNPSLLIKRIDRDLESEEIELGIYKVEAEEGSYTYQIDVVNIGDGYASEVVLTENIAAQLERVTTEGNYSFDPEAQTITVNFGSIAPGKKKTVIITLTANKTNTCSISTLDYDEQQTTDEIKTCINKSPLD